MCGKKTNKNKHSAQAGSASSILACNTFPFSLKCFLCLWQGCILGFNFEDIKIWRPNRKQNRKKHGTHLVSASLNLACNIFHFLCIVSSVAFKFLRCQKIKQSIH